MDHAGKQIHTISMCKKHAAMKAQPWQTNKHAAIMAQPIASIQPPDPTYADSHQAFRLNLYILSSIILSI